MRKIHFIKMIFEIKTYQILGAEQCNIEGKDRGVSLRILDGS
jgi:hypothetical protein